MVPGKRTDYDAIVIGAGFSGIRTLWELIQLGLTVKCFEAGTDVGGAWYWNRYPGFVHRMYYDNQEILTLLSARTDSEAWVYNMNFAAELKDQFDYSERYPSQKEVQLYLARVANLYDLRKYVQFGARVLAAHYDDADNEWRITLADGSSKTCRYFLAATGPLSIPKDPLFAGLETFTGEWYHAANWPKQAVDMRGKRVAVVGTGATGVQIIPEIASVTEELIIFQRTPNYVLPGRNYLINQHKSDEIKKDYAATWNHASNHPFGLAMIPSGNVLDDATNETQIRQILDAGWESGGFHFQFETFDDLFTNQQSNDIASEYLRQKIRAIVKDPVTADLLCPKYPFLSKRPPCGHFYYETFNRANVKLVDIRNNDISVYEKGVRTKSGVEYEVDIIIFALGFDAGTGALNEIDVTGRQGQSLKKLWSNKLETFAGVLVPGFPNMFSVCGPHIPFGNMPVVLDIEVGWIGKTLRHMKEKNLEKIEVKEDIVHAWSSHLDEAFRGTLFGDSARTSGAWFVGANIPGKSHDVLFYFGGVPVWTSWLKKELEAEWTHMTFSSTPTLESVVDISNPSRSAMALNIATRA